MTTTLRCEEFDELLPDYLEETLSAGANLAAQAHLRSCVRCTGLVGELAGIRQAAAALPALTPSRDLWEGIAARIDAPVASIGTSSRTTASRRISRGWLAAAAVALVTLSSGTTYWMTRGTAPSARVSSAVGQAVPEPVSPAIVAVEPPLAGEAGEVRSAPSPVNQVARSISRRPRPAEAPSLEATYEKEVAALRRILSERSRSLDPKTVAILEASLGMIDLAIVQSRQALAADPASRFLRDQVNKALDRKVEVLRTAALLPART